jgi:hypothetical protein
MESRYILNIYRTSFEKIFSIENGYILKGRMINDNEYGIVIKIFNK